MASDTPTVGEANRALLVEINDCLERAFAQTGKGSGRIVELVDALIAAVRAEEAERLRLERMHDALRNWPFSRTDR